MKALVIIAGAEGSLTPLRHILRNLPTANRAAIVLVIAERLREQYVIDALIRDGVDVHFAEHGEALKPGGIYLAPPDRHVTVDHDKLLLNTEGKVNRKRPAADPLFTSAAATFQGELLGVVLSGEDTDGAVGLPALRAAGGITIVQHPDVSINSSMPHAALMADSPTACLSTDGISKRLQHFCS